MYIYYIQIIAIYKYWLGYWWQSEEDFIHIIHLGLCLCSTKFFRGGRGSGVSGDMEKHCIMTSTVVNNSITEQ